MKKLIAPLLVAIALAIGVSACGEKKEDNTGPVTQDVITQSTTEATAPTAPESATDTVPNPPDGGIGNKPGGSSGEDPGTAGSGGVTSPDADPAN